MLCVILMKNTRCDRTTASVLARSANDAGASTDFVSQAERKAPISYCKTPTNAAARVLTRSANEACASTDFVSQAERKALLTSVSQVGESRYKDGRAGSPFGEQYPFPRV